jgi:hypothetical protein
VEGSLKLPNSCSLHQNPEPIARALLVQKQKDSVKISVFDLTNSGPFFPPYCGITAGPVKGCRSTRDWTPKKVLSLAREVAYRAKLAKVRGNKLSYVDPRPRIEDRVTGR